MVARRAEGRSKGLAQLAGRAHRTRPPAGPWRMAGRPNFSTKWAEEHADEVAKARGPDAALRRPRPTWPRCTSRTYAEGRPTPGPKPAARICKSPSSRRGGSTILTPTSSPSPRIWCSPRERHRPGHNSRCGPLSIGPRRGSLGGRKEKQSLVHQAGCEKLDRETGPGAIQWPGRSSARECSGTQSCGSRCHGVWVGIGKKGDPRKGRSANASGWIGRRPRTSVDEKSLGSAFVRHDAAAPRCADAIHPIDSPPVFAGHW